MFFTGLGTETCLQDMIIHLQYFCYKPVTDLSNFAILS